MGQKYEQLSLEQRCTIARHRQAGKTIRQIATAMDRAPSTIARELKRNSGSQVGYQPAYAEQQLRAVAGKEAACFVTVLCRSRFSVGWARLVASPSRGTIEEGKRTQRH